MRLYDDKGRAQTERGNVQHWTTPDGAVVVVVVVRDDALESTVTYDEFGNVIRTTFSDGSYVTSEFDDLGRRTAETSQVAANGVATGPTGQRKQFGYDDQGRLTSVTLPNVILTPLPDGVAGPAEGGTPVYEYGYDVRGNMVSIQDPLERVTWFTFDAQGRQRVARPILAGSRTDKKSHYRRETLRLTWHCSCGPMARLPVRSALDHVWSGHPFDGQTR